MRPAAAGILLSQLLAETPPRLLKKLEGQPGLADQWRWESQGEAWLVTTSQGEKVRLLLRDGRLQSLDDLTCTCLLAPRCLHRLAVLSLLPLADMAESEQAQAIASAEQFSQELNRDQLRAAAELFEVGARVLNRGAEGCGLVDQGELQRVAFQCRQHGLHRGAAAATRLLSSLRHLREGHPDYSLGEMAEQLHELLEVGFRLSQPDADPHWLGQARRLYQPAGSLKLWGLFSEAVVTASGYAGCVTFLIDRRGQVFKVSDVTPGGWERAQQAYRAGTTLPGLSIGHQQLGRSLVLVQSATVSADGRLGSGQSVSAAVNGASSWSDPELSELWDWPWDQQLRERELLFLEGEVLGIEGEALIVEREGRPLRLVTSGASLKLPGRDNLGLLARTQGGRWRWIARLHPGLERTLVALAVSGPFPAGWENRANLSLDRLQTAWFTNLHARPRLLSSSPSLLPWAGLERRLWRVAQAGRDCARPDQQACRQWREVHLAGAARLWEGLVGQAQAGSRDIRGHWVPGGGPDFALHWLGAMTYLQKGRQTWLRECWG
ncbi:MAG: SWIM zinc finger family protein [Vulcanimicrobiota bacterium]